MATKSQLKHALEKVESPKILVIGDLMLDRYSWGSVNRISPEAPIPVLRAEREENRLGGAANAMCNLAALGAQVLACGVLGEDRDGAVVQELFEKHGIESDGVFLEKGLKTILKHRMIAGQHHLLRMDFDPPSDWKFFHEAALLDYLKATIPRVDLVLISDYGKGLLTETILDTIRSLTHPNAIPTLVDPRQKADYQIYRGFTLIKPNRKEAETAMGAVIENVENARHAAEQMQKDYGFQYVAISLDRQGLLLFAGAGECLHFESESQEVFDVVGAGDMVMSVLAFLMAGKVSIEHAAAWANLAAGLEVMHVGVISFTKSDLLQALDGGGTTKVISLENLLPRLKKESLPIIFTNGYFDNISAGHLQFLQQMRQFKGVRVVAINSDRAILEQKGTPSVLNEQERASILASIESVDWVVIFDDKDAGHLIEKLRPSVVLKGKSQQPQELVEQTMIDSVGAVVHYLPEYP